MEEHHKKLPEAPFKNTVFGDQPFQNNKQAYGLTKPMPPVKYISL